MEFDAVLMLIKSSFFILNVSIIMQKKLAECFGMVVFG